MKAVWKDTVIAESDRTEEVEGNQYFPPESVKKEYLKDSETDYHCPWKGDAAYYHLEVDGEKQEDAAWAYPDPKPAAQKIAGYVAFGDDVEVKE